MQLNRPWNILTLLGRKHQKSCRSTCTWKKFKTASLLLTVSPLLNSFPRSHSWLQSRLAGGSARSQDLLAQNIQAAASQLAETAVSTIEMFQQNISHGLLERADAQQAPQHLDAFLGKLGLDPHQHDSVAKAEVCSVYERSSDGVKQEQLASLTEVCALASPSPVLRCFPLCTMLCLLCMMVDNKRKEQCLAAGYSTALAGQ